MLPAVTSDSTIVGPRRHRPMIENDSPTRGPPGTEEAVRGWYTTYNEDGGFPDGYGDADGEPIFVVESLVRENAWIAVSAGHEVGLETWR